MPSAALLAPSALLAPALPTGWGLPGRPGLPGTDLPVLQPLAGVTNSLSAGVIARPAAEAKLPAEGARAVEAKAAAVVAASQVEASAHAATAAASRGATFAAKASAGPQPSAPDSQAGWGDGAKLFDGSGSVRSDVDAPKVSGTGARVAAPAALFGALALPLAASHAHLSLTAMAPALGSVGYDLANVLSVAFPLPEAYQAFRRGHAHGFPLARAILGAVGTIALGTINAVMLGKPLWGVMHVFIGLGMIAPYVIGRALEKRGPMHYAPPQWAVKPTLRQSLGDRLRRDRAVLATAAVAAVMLALGIGVYAAAASFVPALLAAHLTASGVAALLLGIQIAKGALFVAVFAPDVAALARGKPTRGFSTAFTAIYLASVAAFTLWGFSAAAMTAAGPIRDQYLVAGVRNLFETVASALSLWALRRAARRAR